MSPETSVGDKEDKRLTSAKPGKPLQNPQPPRNKKTPLADNTIEQNPSTERD
jgi:hypothetical protein